MSGSLLILVAVGGGFFGVLLGGMMLFILAREWLKQKLGPGGLMGKILADAHEKGVCPVCERPMIHSGDPHP